MSVEVKLVFILQKSVKTVNFLKINAGLFYGPRYIGKGAEACKLLCWMLNLPKQSTASS